MTELRELAEEESRLDMTPMIDVTFLLLVFFMCTLRFKTLEGKLAASLPRDVGSLAPSTEPLEPVRVSVRVVEPGHKLHPDGRPYHDPTGRRRFVYDASRALEYTAGTFKTRDLRALGTRLAAVRRARLAAALVSVPLAIDARPGVTHGEVVEVLDEGHGAGFTDVRFAAAERRSRE